MATNPDFVEAKYVTRKEKKEKTTVLRASLREAV